MTFSRGPAPAVPVVVAALAGLLGSLTCLLASRAVLTSAAAALAGRRGRELTVGVGVLVVSLFGVAGPALSEVGRRLETGAVDAAVQVAAWSPLGAAWSAPWAAAEGRWAVAGARLVVAALTPAVLWWLYVGAVERRLRPSGTVRARSLRAAAARATGVRAADAPVAVPGRSRSLLPDTPLGALTGGALRYWVRDSRYQVSVVTLPVVTGLLLALPVLTDASRGLALATGPLLGLLLGITMLNELAFDGSAFWTTLATGVRGRDDRIARVLALLMWGVPAVVLSALLGAYVAGRPALAPAVVGLALGALLVGNAVAAVSSVALPFPVPPAGSNPFAGNPGGGTAALAQQGLAMLVLVPLLLPLLGLAVWAWFTPPVGWALLGAGTVYGGGLLAVGVTVGGRIMDRRAPELLARLSR